MTIDYTGRKYAITPYNLEWVERFTREADIVRPIFSNVAITIEHVGSTAVPGLSGKPTIDILVLVDDISVVDPLNSKMEELGYKALGDYIKKGSRLFVREEDGDRLCNVHVFQKDHPHAQSMLKIRDYFRAHPELVQEYSNFKNELFVKYPTDYGMYRKYKDEWMEELKQREGF